MRRIVVGALALVGLGTLAFAAYAALVDISLQMLGNPDEDPLAEPWGDC